MKNVVIFDMDGVIVDSELLNDQHEKAYFEKLGIDTTVYPLAGTYRGINSKTLWTLLKTSHGLQEEVDVLIQNGRISYLTFLKSLPELPIVPGVRQLIKLLVQSGHKLALASSANPKRIDLFLKRLKLANYFEVIISGDDVVHGKPHPEVFLLAAERLGHKPSQCVVIEDSTAGVKAAKAAGMKSIGFAGLPHNKENLSEADVVISDFRELSELVKKGQL